MQAQVMFDFVGKVLVLQPEADASFVAKGEGLHPMLPPAPGLWVLRDPTPFNTVTGELAAAGVEGLFWGWGMGWVCGWDGGKGWCCCGALHTVCSLLACLLTCAAAVVAHLPASLLPCPLPFPPCSHAAARC